MTGRHVGARPSAGDGTGLRRWAMVWRGLRVASGPALVLALLAAVTAAYLVATPRLESRSADHAVADVLDDAPAQSREISLRAAPAVPGYRPSVSTTPGPGPAAPFGAVDEAVRAVLGPELVPLLRDATWGGQSEPVTLTRATGESLLADRVSAVARVQSGLAERVRWTSGATPGAPTEEGTVEVGGADHRVRVVPVALAEDTARSWGVQVGDRLTLVPEGDLTPALAEVAGTYVARDPADGFWAAEPRLLGLAAIPTPQGGVIQQGALAAAPEAYGALTDAMWRSPATLGEVAESPVLTTSWRYALDADRLTGADVEPVRRGLVRLDTDARMAGLTSRPLEVTTGLGSLLDRYDAAVRGARVMTSFATAGLTALAVLVLTLTAVVAVGRRAAEVRLVRARGAGLVQVLVQVVTGTALPTLPVAALAVAVTALAVPGVTGAGPWVEVVLVALVPLLATAVAVLVRVRAGERSDSSAEAVRRTRVLAALRRVVLELALVAVAVLAVTTVRSRGAEIAAGRTDWFAALTPVLVAVAAALVVLRVVPWPVGWAARLAGRGRGLVGFLGLARAARTGAVAALPVVALVVGAAVLALFASLTMAVQTQREVAAYRAVGADVEVGAVRVDAEDVDALAARPGVRSVVPAYVDLGAQLVAGDTARAVALVATSVPDYAGVVAGTPAALPAALPAATADGGPVPVLAGAVPTGGELELLVRGKRIPVRAAAVDPDLVRRGTGGELPAVVVDLSALREVVPVAQPNTAYLAADPDAAAALTTLPDPRESTPSGRVLAVDSAAAFAQRVEQRALPGLVVTTYSVGAVLAGLLTLLAVLLLLTATRPERTALVLRLRTMGLPHGAERGLAWSEVLPVVAVAALAGAAVGVLAPSLVDAAVDLAPFTGGAPRPPVDPRPGAAAGAGALVLTLGALALVLDAAAARRGHLADHLRKGDTA